ncbi:WW domain-containing oxidoreductase [Madurella mycetomatis]|uniref:WW domain-containing oxidoreductase n=1 Tax=Madurella mycetomatis TaxID=100816 RepID=A0A175VZP4_9PEZI|nr:WW domain-containing oxidoreductase [Madurella mycetomatis]
MAGTIIFTGANGSVAIPAVEHLLTHSPNFTLVLTVRDDGDGDTNTKELRRVIAKHNAYERASVRKLDLASLKAVHEFTDAIAAEVSQGSLPRLASVVCNAYYWNLLGPLELTGDGYEKSMQVCHLAHVALVLQLLNSFGSDGGRIVLFASDAHEPGKNNLEVIPPSIPTDPEKLEFLARPAPDDASVADNASHGFCRYATAKLAVVTWGHALNRRLEKDPKLSRITATIINPGNLADSRALRVNTPQKMVVLSKFVLQPLRPVLRLMDPTLRKSAEAGVDVARLATNIAHPGERGYFTLLNRDESSAESRDEARQDVLWTRSAQWAGVRSQDSPLPL